MECNEIMRRLPHSFPFLMIDRVIEMQVGFRGKGIKNITMNEPYFQGHFPNQPIVPGVMMVEMIAQMAALVYQSNDAVNVKELKNMVGFIAKIEEVKFIQRAVPGDQLIVEVENEIIYENYIKVRARISKENSNVLTGKIIVTMNKSW